MTYVFAFLHHVAAFVFVSTLVVEAVLISDVLTLRSARRLQLADLTFGISAGVVLVVGFLRVFYFEKGASYYFHSVPFLAKLSLFAVVGMLSIYPTVEFLSWRKSLKHGQLPEVDDSKIRLIRSIIRLELGGIVLLIFAAVLMARGLGYVG
jgi:putative membrane protein